MKATEEKRERRGLYFALAVCLVAIGIAAWGTYNSVSSYMSSKTPVSGTPIQTEREKEDPEQISRPPATAVVPQESSPTAENEATESTAETNAAPLPEDLPEPEAEDVDAPLYSLREDFSSPLPDHKILAPFSGGKLIYSETMKDWRTHTGQDIAAEKGETVVACNNGVVAKTYSDLLLGNVVIVEHGDYRFWYCGLGDTFLVKEGEIVSRSTPLGSVTIVPSENTGTHLHLQVEKEGSFIDPDTIPFA